MILKLNYLSFIFSITTVHVYWWTFEKLGLSRPYLSRQIKINNYTQRNIYLGFIVVASYCHLSLNFYYIACVAFEIRITNRDMRKNFPFFGEFLFAFYFLCCLRVWKHWQRDSLPSSTFACTIKTVFAFDDFFLFKQIKNRMSLVWRRVYSIVRDMENMNFIWRDPCDYILKTCIFLK